MSGEQASEEPQIAPDRPDLFLDLKAFMEGTGPAAPPRVVATRDDGEALLYAGQVTDLGVIHIALVAQYADGGLLDTRDRRSGKSHPADYRKDLVYICLTGRGQLSSVT